MTLGFCGLPAQLANSATRMAEFAVVTLTKDACKGNDMQGKEHVRQQASYRTRVRRSPDPGLGAVIFLALALGSIQAKPPTESDAINFVLNQGGSFKRDEKIATRPVVEVDLSLTSVTDADLKDLLPLKHLRLLNLTDTLVSDAGIQQLAGFRDLRELVLDDTPVTDGALKELARQRKDWRALSLAGTKITDEGLKSLRGQKELQLLDLAGNQITDSGIMQLAGAKKLKWLWLAGTKISDFALGQLAGHEDLIEVQVSGTLATPDGIQQLRKALPKCKVDD